MRLKPLRLIKVISSTLFVLLFSLAGIINAYAQDNHSYVDLGLPSGTLWATCNVGANAPEEYGDYFAWGETEPKDNYNWPTYQYCHGSYNSLTKYCNNSIFGYYSFTDNLTILQPEDDAATANWGSNWHMPTNEEWQELLNNTLMTWITQNGIKGSLFTSLNGNSIFLPASGYYDGNNLNNAGEDGFYWSSSLYSPRPELARGIQVYTYGYGFNGRYRFYGQSVRPVCSAPQNSTPTGAINGLFSVDEDTQVYFSQGNLQYQASTDTWRFAENQWDYVGDANRNISSTYDGWIDLFGWGTSGYHDYSDSLNTNFQPWSINRAIIDDTYNKYGYGPSTNMASPNLTGSSAFYDWGVYNPISNGGDTAHQWRSLTQQEWIYVFNTRPTSSGIRYARANVNNVNGIILLPDDWNENTYSLNYPNEPYVDFDNNVITAMQWNVLQSSGAIFLPASGNRMGYSVNNVGSYGNYWTSSYYGNFGACRVEFYNSHTNFNYGYYRYIGYAVRLVCPSQTTTSCYIEVSPNPAEGGIITGAGVYEYGQTCTLTTTPNQNYTFVNWTKNGTVVSTETTYSFTVTESATYLANFSRNAFHFTIPGTWSTPSNWSNGALPGATDEVFIDAPCQLDQNATVTALAVSGGQSLLLQSGKTLTVTGNLSNTVATSLVIEDGAQLIHNVANVQATVRKHITPFIGSDDSWHLIALPLTGSSNVASVSNLLEGEYDLYGYDEATTYWKNRKTTGSGFTVLQATKGYLYANGEEVTLGFSGTLENSSATITVPLSYTDGAHLSGFNLVGNPFPCNAYLNKDYYVLSADGSGINSNPISANTPIPPCTAVFVKAEGDGETVVFTRVVQ